VQSLETFQRLIRPELEVTMADVTLLSRVRAWSSAAAARREHRDETPTTGSFQTVDRGDEDPAPRRGDRQPAAHTATTSTEF